MIEGEGGPPNGEGEDTSSPPTEHTRSDYWTFKGYCLTAAEFNSAMIHFYRGEIARSVAWRTRLDATTNWAVVTAGALLTFSLGDASKPHFVIPIGTMLILMFLFVEARRYRYYELWTARVRLMETDFFGAMLMPPFAPSEDWAEALTSSLLNPQFPVSLAEALGRRLRQNYLLIFLILAATWVLKVVSSPTPVSTWSDFMARAAVGPFPGPLVVGVGVVFNAILVLFAYTTMRLQEAPGEVMPRYTVSGKGGLAAQIADAVGAAGLTLPWTRRDQHVVYIISRQAAAIGGRILSELKRGVTTLSARGLYTGEEVSCLMCALTPRDLPKLKHLVAQIDNKSFVIVMPAQEIHGRGFHPLDNQ